MLNFALEKEKKPHQSRLGNSSNYIEMPRLFLSLMAGLNPKGCRKTRGLQRRKKTQILSIGVSSHSLMWVLYGGGEIFFSATFLFKD